MISIALSAELRAAGLAWEPASGDRFVIDKPQLHDSPFVLSDMVVEVHDYPTGRLIGFNGTTEWALDSVEMGEALWLPGEPHLRELLGAAFVRLERTGTGYRVVARIDGEERATQEEDVAEAYGKALLALMRAGGTPARIRTPYIDPAHRVASNGHAH